MYYHITQRCCGLGTLCGIVCVSTKIPFLGSAIQGHRLYIWIGTMYLLLVHNYPNVEYTFICNAQVDAFNMSVNVRRNGTSCDKNECKKHSCFRKYAEILVFAVFKLLTFNLVDVKKYSNICIKWMLSLYSYNLTQDVCMYKCIDDLYWCHRQEPVGWDHSSCQRTQHKQ